MLRTSYTIPSLEKLLWFNPILTNGMVWALFPLPAGQPLSDFCCGSLSWGDARVPRDTKEHPGQQLDVKLFFFPHPTHPD